MSYEPHGDAGTSGFDDQWLSIKGERENRPRCCSVNHDHHGRNVNARGRKFESNRLDEGVLRFPWGKKTLPRLSSPASEVLSSEASV